MGLIVEDIARLPPSERAARYREFAEHAETMAQTAWPMRAAEYITLAEDWRKLAILIELTAQR